MTHNARFLYPPPHLKQVLITGDKKASALAFKQSLLINDNQPEIKKFITEKLLAEESAE